MKRRIVFVSLVFHPDSSATGMLFADLLRRVAPYARITVLCGYPSKDGNEALRRLPRREVWNDIEVIRCGARMQGKRNLMSRFWAYSTFLFEAGVRLLGVGEGATVVGGTDPPFTPVALWLLSLLRPFTYQTILHDIYPDGLISLGSLHERSIVAAVWRHLNRRSFRAAERVIVIGRDSADLVRRTYGVDPSRISYIPYWATEEVDVQCLPDRSSLLTELGLQDKFVVQYSGNMGLWHDIDVLVRAAALVQNDPRIHFLFIGQGIRRAAAEHLSRQLGLTNVTWLPFAPREALPRTLTACDAALISFRAGLEGVAVPSKLYGILATGRPVIAQVPDESEVALTLREAGCGVIVPPGDAEALASAVVAVVAETDEAVSMGRRAASTYRRHFSLDRAVSRFCDAWDLYVPGEKAG